MSRPINLSLQRWVKQCIETGDVNTSHWPWNPCWALTKAAQSGSDWGLHLEARWYQTAPPAPPQGGSGPARAPGSCSSQLRTGLPVTKLLLNFFPLNQVIPTLFSELHFSVFPSCFWHCLLKPLGCGRILTHGAHMQEHTSTRAHTHARTLTFTLKTRPQEETKTACPRYII